MTKTTKIIIGIIIIIIVIGGIWYGLSRKPQEEVIKIGVILPLTGFAAQYGENIDEAIQLALEEINSTGGILGKKIRVIYEDTKCTAKEGAVAVNKLINVDKVDLIIACECSGPTASAIPIAEQNKKLFIIAIATAPGLASQGEYVFRITPSDSAQGRDLAETMWSENYRKVAILHGNNDYGVGIKDVFKDVFENKGGEIVISETFGDDATDFRTQLTKIKQKQPEALLLVAYTDQYIQLFKQIKELNIETQVFASETLKDEDLMKEMGTLADGAIITYYTSPSTEKRESFINKMEKKYGEKPGTYADFTYDAFWIVEEAISKAGKLDTEAIRSSLKSISYAGVTGLTEFDEEGEVKRKSFMLYRLKNGQFVPYEE